MFGWPHMFYDTPTYVWMLPVCYIDVWMPPVHTQHKESMLCQAKGVSICPNTFGCHPYVWIPPVCLDGPICLNTPHICLDASCMFGYPPYVWTSHMFGCCLYVWMMFGCLLYMYNTKKACFVRLRGVHMPPIHLYTPICLDAHLYVWMPPYVWTPSCMFG